MATSNSSALESELFQELHNRYNLVVSQQWLSTFVGTVRNPPPPLLALSSTAHFRVLNSDITQSLSRSNTSQPPAQLLPSGVSDVNVKELLLRSHVLVQVLDIIDVGSSKWSQVETIERIERGEEVRGREVIRNVPIMNEGDDSNAISQAGVSTGTGPHSAKKSGGPHRLLLQDAAGTKVWGFELISIPKVHLTTSVDDGGLQIGAKMLLKSGTVVRRGLAMLQPDLVTVMGGKVEDWDKKWRVERKSRLIEQVKREHEQRQEEN